MTGYEDILRKGSAPGTAPESLDTVAMTREHPVITVELVLNDKDADILVYVDSNDPHYESQVEHALTYFSRLYRGQGTLSTNAADSFAAAGVRSDTPPRSWMEYKEPLNEEYLLKLREAGVSDQVLSIIAEDLKVEQNVDILRALVEERFSAEDRADIERALDYALDAHACVMQARPQDTEGLFHIPYSNHPVCIAIAALQAPDCSAELIQAILLHDVVEDTDRTIEDIAMRFSEGVVNMVTDVTRTEKERSDFLERMKTLTGDPKVLKCLDRFHNMIRAFSISDRTYHDRILAENREVYDEYFKSSRQLAHLRPMWDELTKELSAYRDTLG